MGLISCSWQLFTFLYCILLPQTSNLLDLNTMSYMKMQITNGISSVNAEYLPCSSYKSHAYGVTYIVYTCWSKAKLSADHISISVVPKVITHSAPCIVVANLHTTTRVCRPCPSKADITIHADWQIWRSRDKQNLFRGVPLIKQCLPLIRLKVQNSQWSTWNW